MVKSTVKASWCGRDGTVDDSARDVARFMDRLAAVHPTLTNWHNQAHDEIVVTGDHDDLVARLLKGRNRDDGNQVIESLGYALFWVNGANGKPETIGLNIHIGKPANAILVNGVSLSLPDPKAVPDLYAPAIARGILYAFVEVFSPDWMVWCNHATFVKQKGPERPTPDGRGTISGKVIGYEAGWANYLDDTNPVQFELGLLPAGATAERLDAGTLVLLGGDPADPPIEDVLQVRRAMGYEVPEPAQPPGDARGRSAPPSTVLTPAHQAHPHAAGRTSTEREASAGTTDRPVTTEYGNQRSAHPADKDE